MAMMDVEIVGDVIVGPPALKYPPLEPLSSLCIAASSAEVSMSAAESPTPEAVSPSSTHAAVVTR